MIRLAFVALALLSACNKEEQPAAKSEAPAPPADLPAPPDVAAPPADAEKSASGLAWKVLQPGRSEDKPRKWDSVEVHYTGWTTDGKMFDSSVKRGRPARFPLKGVIPGWTEGLQLMKVGEKRRFWIPAALGYGESPGGGRPGGMLVFDVELLSITKGPEPIPAPPDVAAPPADAKKTASGLVYKVLTPGQGKKKAAENDRVEFHFTSWASDGEMLDSSVQRNRPVSFTVDRAPIPGWQEALRLMSEGEKTRFWMPPSLTPARPPTDAGGLMVFDMEMLKITEMPKPPPVPKDVAAAPASAKKTASGLAYRVLKKGTGKRKPVATDRVEVHYSGWTTDGKMFDSSVTRGQTATFGLNQVIKGWTEGLQLMVEGEQTRFWIPAELAYGTNPGGGRPAGMLCFDVELVKILDGTTPGDPHGH
jgi:FKBP-type peptidyl-prolyl cis-trans isomerase